MLLDFSDHIWAPHDKTTKVSLSNSLPVGMKKTWFLSYPLSAQQRLWSDLTNLSLHWAHMPFCWFCHEVAYNFMQTAACFLCFIYFYLFFFLFLFYLFIFYFLFFFFFFFAICDRWQCSNKRGYPENIFEYSWKGFSNHHHFVSPWLKYCWKGG